MSGWAAWNFTGMLPRGARLRTVLGTHNVDRFGDPQTRVHIRKKPQTGDDRLLQDRPDKDSRYSALVWAVLTDRKLEPVDWGVYACLSARAFKTNTLQMGTRWIAGSLGIKKGRAQASIGRLVARRHVEVVEPACGSRPPVYRLVSAVFAKRQKVIVSGRGGNVETTRAELNRKRELLLKLRTA